MTYGGQFMICPECGGQAESDAVDVGVGLYIAGNFWCECGWEICADGMARVGSYEDWFPDDAPTDARQQCGVRHIGTIAHIDRGKTALATAFLRAAGL